MTLCVEITNKPYRQVCIFVTSFTCDYIFWIVFRQNKTQ